MAVSLILKTKGRSVISVKPSDTVRHVADKLSQHKIGAVVVLDEDENMQGIVSERDIVRTIAQKGEAALSLPAASIMTSDVKSCREGDTEADIMGLMTAHRIRHLPVVMQGRMVGIISIGDVVKHRIEAIEREADEMKTYIATAG